MTDFSASQPSNYLIDTHTHFDDFVFDNDRVQLAKSAYNVGVRHLTLIGYLVNYFDRMQAAKQQLVEAAQVPDTHVAFGLHPAYIAEHSMADLDTLADYLAQYPCIAVGEIGLDTYTDALKTPESLAKQQQFFVAQLELAVCHDLPVLLHIRKAHAQCLAILKSHRYNAKNSGGIAHSFSGGEQEAKAFVKLGFKLGVTGQYTNPNAKKLHRAIAAVVEEYGISCLVLETDCPDMTPIGCQHPDDSQHHATRNVPHNLSMVLISLSETLHLDIDYLANQLWQNSCDALNVNWPNPNIL